MVPVSENEVSKWAPGLCVHTLFVSSGAVYCFALASKLMFQNGIWQGEMSNYAHSCISGAQGVNAMRVCVGTQALVYEHQVCTAPKTSKKWPWESKMCELLAQRTSWNSSFLLSLLRFLIFARSCIKKREEFLWWIWKHTNVWELLIKSTVLVTFLTFTDVLKQIL